MPQQIDGSNTISNPDVWTGAGAQLNVSYTYAQLSALASAGGLTPNSWYVAAGVRYWAIDAYTLSPDEPAAADASQPFIMLDDLLTNLNSAVESVLTLPNPYAPGQSHAPVHPSLLYVAEGWNGYRYWLAYTPYPGADSQYENPCVAASNDLETWVEPATNPIVAWPGGASYNADTHLVLSPDGATMYMLFVERGSGISDLQITESTDGATWSTPISVMTGAIGVQGFASPSAWWNGSAWVLISHNVDASLPWPIERRVSSGASIYGSYGSPTAVTPAAVTLRGWWHSFFMRLPSGQILGIAQDATASGGSGDLYWMESGDDGATISVGAQVASAGGKYRSTFAVRDNKVDLLYGTLAGVITHVVPLTGRLAARKRHFAEMASMLAGAAVTGAALWADTFVRGDSAGSLGAATSGGTYTASSGTWGVSTNRAYPVSTGRVLASVGTPNHRVSVRFLDMTTAVQQWVIGRAVDGSNYWRCGVVSPPASGAAALALQQIVAGAVNWQLAISTFVRGDVVTLEFSGATLSVAVNGVVVYTRLAGAPVGSSFGMQASTGANTFMSNLVVAAT